MNRILRSRLYLDRSPQTVHARHLAGQVTTSARVSPPAAAPADAPVDEVPDKPPQPVVSEELRTLLSAIEVSVHDAEQMRRQSLEEFQQLAVELAVIIAGELVFRAIDAEQFDVRGLVSAAVSQLGLDAPLTISLNPQDLQLLESQPTDEPPLWQTGTVAFRADPSLPRGNCRATNGATVLLSEFAPRLEEIRDLLLEGLDDAQIERRQASGIGSTLKRFPDRRETA